VAMASALCSATCANLLGARGWVGAAWPVLICAAACVRCGGPRALPCPPPVRWRHDDVLPERRQTQGKRTARRGPHLGLGVVGWRGSGDSGPCRMYTVPCSSSPDSWKKTVASPSVAAASSSALRLPPTPLLPLLGAVRPQRGGGEGKGARALAGGFYSRGAVMATDERR
jgi:hypothetical protein